MIKKIAVTLFIDTLFVLGILCYIKTGDQNAANVIQVLFWPVCVLGIVGAIGIAGDLPKYIRKRSGEALFGNPYWDAYNSLSDILIVALLAYGGFVWLAGFGTVAALFSASQRYEVRRRIDGYVP